MSNFKTFFEAKKVKKKSKKRKEENNETQLNDPYTSTLNQTPTSKTKDNTYLFPPNYGMGEGQRLTGKPGNLN